MSSLGVEIGAKELRFILIEGNWIVKSGRRRFTEGVRFRDFLLNLQAELGEGGAWVVPLRGVYGRLMEPWEGEIFARLLKETLGNLSSDLIFSYQPVGKKVFLGTALKDDLMGYYNLIKGAGFQVNSVEVPVFAAFNALWYNYPEKRGESLTMFHTEGDLLYVLQIDEGTPVLAVSRQIGGDDNRLLEYLIELKETFLENNSDIVVSGELSTKPSVFEAIEAELEIPVIVLDPLRVFEGIDKEEGLESNTLFAAALGAALKGARYA
ncbi:MAG: hypothetical protein J7K11_05745 [Candidatus Hydrothermae bacterium]|nr:hypothetical protein [Candidatus Hydrothermae bacterium]